MRDWLAWRDTTLITPLRTGYMRSGAWYHETVTDGLRFVLIDRIVVEYFSEEIDWQMPASLLVKKAQNADVKNAANRSNDKTIDATLTHTGDCWMSTERFNQQVALPAGIAEISDKQTCQMNTGLMQCWTRWHIVAPVSAVKAQEIVDYRAVEEASVDEAALLVQEDRLRTVDIGGGF